LLQNRRKRQTNARFIIDKEKAIALLGFGGNSTANLVLTFFQSFVEFLNDGEKLLGVLLVRSFSCECLPILVARYLPNFLILFTHGKLILTN